MYVCFNVCAYVSMYVCIRAVVCVEVAPQIVLSGKMIVFQLIKRFSVFYERSPDSHSFSLKSN
jgi:hypothetical protein